MSRNKTDSAGEAIASLETVLGFRPTHSVVLAGTFVEAEEGSLRLRFGQAARIDLDALAADPGIITRLGLVGPDSPEHETGLLAIYYTDDLHDPDFATAFSIIRDAAREAPVLDLVVSGEEYFLLAKPDQRLPLSRLESTVAAAERVLSGRPLVAEGDLVALPRVEPPEAQQMLAALRVLHARAMIPGGIHEVARTALAVWRRATAEQGPASIEETAAFICTIQRTTCRDAILFAPIPGAEGLAERMIDPAHAHDDEPEAARLFARALTHDLNLPFLQPPGQAMDLATQAAAHSPTGMRAPALSVLSWMSMIHGDTTRALRWANAALQDDPDYRLAGLLRTVAQIPLDTSQPPAPPTPGLRQEPQL